MGRTLVTRHAGFIGFHLAQRLLERGDPVVGFDVVNDYYDPLIKEARLDVLAETARRTNASYVSVRESLRRSFQLLPHAKDTHQERGRNLSRFSSPRTRSICRMRCAS